MKYLLIVFISVLTIGCGGGEGGSSGGGSSSRTGSSSSVVQATVYTFELSGNGVTYSADLHGYAARNYGGAQTNPTYNSVTLGAATVTYTLNSESMIANITLNTGAGVLTIVTKKNGVLFRSDTINTNATNISINDAN